MYKFDNIGLLMRLKDKRSKILSTEKIIQPFTPTPGVQLISEFLNLPLAYEPVRTNRFIVNFPNELNLPNHTVRRVNIPSFVNNGWTDMEITFNEYITPSVTQSFFDIINSDNNDNFEFTIDMLDPAGVSIRKWVYDVAYISEVTFGDGIDYSSEEVLEVNVKFVINNCILIY